MVKPDDLTRFLGMLSPAKYGNLRLLRQRDKEVALRERSFDSTEYSWEQVVCRVVWNGYGIASTDQTDDENVERVCKLALRSPR